MLHEQPHPLSGKNFRVDFGDDLHAIHDTIHHGKVIRLEDWADRMNQSDLSTRTIEVLLSFYIHRCHPELEPVEPISLSSVNLEGVVYGTVVDTRGDRFVKRVILREVELAEI